MADVPSLTRRELLRGAAATAIAVPLGTIALTSCSREPSPAEVLAGRLVPLASAAAASATAARALTTAEPRHAAALTEVAGIRDRHARLLREEVTRLHPASAALIAAPGSTSAARPAATSAAPAPQATGLDALRAGLTADAAAARAVATTTSGFQAGLTASVSASITSLAGLLS